MHRVAELLRGRLSPDRRAASSRRSAFAVGAPVALVGAGFGIEHHDAAVGIAVGGEDFLRGDIDRDVGRRAEPVGRVAVVAGAGLPICSTNLPSMRELEQLTVLLAVAGEPDEIIVVDEDAVLALRPLVAGARAAPVAQQIAGLVEHQHRRRGDAALCLRRVLLGGAFARGERASGGARPRCDRICRSRSRRPGRAASCSAMASARTDRPGTAAPVPRSAPASRRRSAGRRSRRRWLAIGVCSVAPCLPLLQACDGLNDPRRRRAASTCCRPRSSAARRR